MNLAKIICMVPKYDELPVVSPPGWMIMIYYTEHTGKGKMQCWVFGLGMLRDIIEHSMFNYVINSRRDVATPKSQSTYTYLKEIRGLQLKNTRGHSPIWDIPGVRFILLALCFGSCVTILLQMRPVNHCSKLQTIYPIWGTTNKIRERNSLILLKIA